MSTRSSTFDLTDFMCSTGFVDVNSRCAEVVPEVSALACGN